MLFICMYVCMYTRILISEVSVLHTFTFMPINGRSATFEIRRTYANAQIWFHQYDQASTLLNFATVVLVYLYMRKDKVLDKVFAFEEYFVQCQGVHST